MDRGHLPEGWKIKKIREIGKVQTGSTPKTSDKNNFGDDISFIKPPDFLKDGSLNYSSQGLSKLGTKEARIIDKDSVLMVCIGATIGKVGFTEKEVTANQQINSLTPLNGDHPKFIFYQMLTKNFQQKVLDSSGQATLPIINKTKWSELSLFLPSPDEQKRIVAILDEAFEGIDQAIRNTEKNLANARELFDSYLNFKLLPVASGHLIQTLASITDLIVDCEHKTAPTQEIGIPSIRTPNIGKGYLIFDNVNRVSEETYELWTKRAKPISGDLILAREAPAGNVGIIPQGERVCLGQRTVLIRPKKNRIDSQFLAFLLLHPLIQKRLLAKSTGATVQHVNMKDIRELKLSELPSIQTQQKLTKELEDLRSQGDRLETIYRQKIAALNELKQSILQKAFTGQLTK
jgi:type I restriction enzyme S subunit